MVSQRPPALTGGFLLPMYKQIFLEGQAVSSRTRLSNNRSVMPFDVLSRTCATLKESACVSWPKGPCLLRARDINMTINTVNRI